LKKAAKAERKNETLMMKSEMLGRRKKKEGSAKYN